MESRHRREETAKCLRICDRPDATCLSSAPIRHCRSCNDRLLRRPQTLRTLTHLMKKARFRATCVSFVTTNAEWHARCDWFRQTQSTFLTNFIGSHTHENPVSPFSIRTRSIYLHRRRTINRSAMCRWCMSASVQKRANELRFVASDQHGLPESFSRRSQLCGMCQRNV